SSRSKARPAMAPAPPGVTTPSRRAPAARALASAQAAGRARRAVRARAAGEARVAAMRTGEATVAGTPLGREPPPARAAPRQARTGAAPAWPARRLARAAAPRARA